ncbi:MAG TPA: peptidylprolyl isomerase [Gemmatimonadales bacterium]|nr:peptidylprolyl isomerase [Gemmatimonadales bacterium]
MRKDEMRGVRMGVAAGLAAALLSGCGDAFTSRVDVVAEAEGYRLGVESMAELVATGKGLPLRRDVVEEISAYWVDYVILADRLARGDSLTDSATVVAAMWAEIQQEIADRFHAQLIGRQTQLDSAAVDSAYAAGRHRLIKHVLFGVEPDAPPTVRETKRRLAEDHARRLQTGALTWAEAAGATDDLRRENEGSLGVVSYGEHPEVFENAAFALAPGEISKVVETSFGYHIIYRPRLEDARQEYREGLELRLENEFNDSYLAALMDRWGIEVKKGIGPAVREAGSHPARAKESGRVIGTHRGGDFRIRDLARWLQAMPLEIRRRLPSASDSQITVLVQTLVRNDALLHEAREAGVAIDSAFVEEARDQLRRQVALMSALLGLPFDSLPAIRALPAARRRALVEERVLQYLRALTQNEKRLQTVPPFLADELREDAEWKVIPAGVERTLERARSLRLASPALPPQMQPPPVTAPADSSAP